MLVLPCKIGCTIKIKKPDEEKVSIKIIKKTDKFVLLSIASKISFSLDNIYYRLKLLTLGSGQDFIITTKGNSKIRVVVIEIKNKVVLGFDADKSIKINRKQNNIYSSL